MKTTGQPTTANTQLEFMVKWLFWEQFLSAIFIRQRRLVCIRPIVRLCDAILNDINQIDFMALWIVKKVSRAKLYTRGTVRHFECVFGLVALGLSENKTCFVLFVAWLFILFFLFILLLYSVISFTKMTKAHFNGNFCNLAACAKHYRFSLNWQTARVFASQCWFSYETSQTGEQ